MKMQPLVLTALLGLACGSPFAAAGEIVFEQGVEYATADGEALQLNLARPKDGSGPFPAILCIPSAA